MTALLIVVAIGSGLIGSLLLTQATAGVGAICFGLLLAVLARINQAGEHHREITKAISSQTDEIRHELREQLKK